MYWWVEPQLSLRAQGGYRGRQRASPVAGLLVSMAGPHSIAHNRETKRRSETRPAKVFFLSFPVLSCTRGTGMQREAWPKTPLRLARVPSDPCATLVRDKYPPVTRSLDLLVPRSVRRAMYSAGFRSPPLPPLQPSFRVACGELSALRGGNESGRDLSSRRLSIFLHSAPPCFESKPCWALLIDSFSGVGHPCYPGPCTNANLTL